MLQTLTLLSLSLMGASRNVQGWRGSVRFLQNVHSVSEGEQSLGFLQSSAAPGSACFPPSKPLSH